MAAVGSTTVHMGVPFLIPALVKSGYSLATAGFIASMPAAGIVATLIAWGWFVDRFGERAAISLGLGLTALTTAVAAIAAQHGAAALAVSLFIAGCAAASVNSASGRVVSGWYPPHQRGAAMGIRQTAQPLGAALSAAVLPVLAANFGIQVALASAAGLCAALAVTCLVGIIDPPRPSTGSPDHNAAAQNPYRGDGRLPYLVRIHLASALLSWPQSMMGAMFLVWLIERGYPPAQAGLIVMCAQLGGAVSRAALGFLSDRVRSRIRPYRWVATGTAVLCLCVAALDYLALNTAATAVMMALSIAAVSHNGLAFTAVAEYCGPLWSGRGLGTQNTFQNIVYASTPALAGLVVTSAGFPALFLLSAAFPAVSVLVSPRADKRRTRSVRRKAQPSPRP
nr:MFS transporter [Corynebacterium sp. TAE3-ERU12]